MELVLLTFLLVALIGALLMLQGNASADRITIAFITWGGILIGAIVAVVKGDKAPKSDD